jgi:hypothetical protein
MDFQKLFDGVSASMRDARKPYHLSLGALRDLAAEAPEGTLFVVQDDDGGISGGIGNEHSYRGYYDDLALERISDPTTAADVLAMCERALSETYEGYKGGDFRYDEDTPLWLAFYGITGLAIVGVSKPADGVIGLVTKVVDAW